MTMDKLDFIEYSASRYNIDFSVGETFGLFDSLRYFYIFTSFISFKKL